MRCFFVSDLHGRETRYRALLAAIESEVPDAVFLGGDLLPAGTTGGRHFITATLAAGFAALRRNLGARYPAVFLIFGNDDPRALENDVMKGENDGLWTYAHGRRLHAPALTVYGYCFVPPTPFQLKDWERYDVSHFVDPGCISPEEGVRTVAADPMDVRYGTIEQDLQSLAGADDVREALFLFHTPPYQTSLDRAALDGKSFDSAPLDVHVGSIAVRRFIESRQPRVTLHGHVHESARLTGNWKERIGSTVIIGAAHDGPELALVRFDSDDPDAATRELIG